MPPSPTSPFPLSEAQILRLRPLPRHQQAILLLSGRLLPGDLPGPLEPSLAFPDDTARWAYLVHLAWAHGRHASVLGGKPAYEAREILAARMRSAVARAGSVARWGSELLRSARVRPEALRADDALWWRGVCAAPEATPWRRLRQRLVQEEVLTAASLLPDWLYAIRGPLPDADLSDLDPSFLPVEIPT